MAVSVSAFLDVDLDQFAQTGALDVVLDVDTKLFIDPHLVKFTKAPELQGSYEKMTKRFSDILKLLEASRKRGDTFWREADRRFTFPEVQGLCIGYSAGSTSGSGIGKLFRFRLLSTAKQIVDAGIKDPELFELMGLFEEGIGADRISDMVARIILDDLMAYSHRIFSELGVKNTHEFEYGGVKYALPVNQFNWRHIILVPRDILRDLPIARSFEDIDVVVGFNRRLRQRLNELIGVTWSQARKVKKKDYRQAVLNEPEILRKILAEYRDYSADTYDFDRDPAGQVVWYPTTKRFAEKYPLELRLKSNPTPEDVLEVVLKICGHFKQNIENNGLHTLLYRDDKCTRPKHEEAAQKVFFGVADAHCQANNLDLSPETNSGRGEVDFKVSRGYRSRVLVETKLTTNSRLLHGFEVQLKEYQDAETTAFSVYLVVDVEGGFEGRVRELRDLIPVKQAEGLRIPEIIFVNARRKPSASRLKVN